MQPKSNGVGFRLNKEDKRRSAPMWRPKADWLRAGLPPVLLATLFVVTGLRGSTSAITDEVYQLNASREMVASWCLAHAPIHLTLVSKNAAVVGACAR